MNRSEYVSPFKKMKQQQQAPVALQKTTLDLRPKTIKITNMPPELFTEEEIRKHFFKSGPISAICFGNNYSALIKFQKRKFGEKAMKFAKLYNDQVLKMEWFDTRSTSSSFDGKISEEIYKQD